MKAHERAPAGKGPATTQPQCGAGPALQTLDSQAQPRLPASPALTVAPAPGSRDRGEQDAEEPETHHAGLTDPGGRLPVPVSG